MKNCSRPSILDFIAKHYPGQNPRHVFARELAIEVFGPLPVWSTRDGNYQISPTTRMELGSFIIPYYSDSMPGKPETERNHISILLQKRSDTGPNGEDRYGVFGGYTNADFVMHGEIMDKSRGEQPEEGALREMNEELLDDKGKPILDIAEDRLNHVISCNDYSKRPGTAVTGFTLRLTPDEFSAVKAHSESMENKLDYRNAVRAASGGEVKQVLIMPLETILAMRENQFTHPHEFKAIQKIAKEMEKYHHK